MSDASILTFIHEWDERCACVCQRENERWRCKKREMLYLLNTYTPELNKIRAPHDSDWNYITIDVMYVLFCCCWYNYAQTEWGYSYRMYAQCTCTGTHAHTNILFASLSLPYFLYFCYRICLSIVVCISINAYPTEKIYISSHCKQEQNEKRSEKIGKYWNKTMSIAKNWYKADCTCSKCGVGGKRVEIWLFPSFLFLFLHIFFLIGVKHK